MTINHYILYPVLFLFLLAGCRSMKSDELSQEIAGTIMPFYNNEKWGYMNKDKEIIVCPIFEEAHPSLSNRSRVKIKDKYGYIDNRGKLVIDAKFDKAEDFDRGLAKVERKGKSYYITSSGERNNISYALCGTHKNCRYTSISKKIQIIEDGGKLGMVHDVLVRDSIEDYFVSDTIPPMFDSIMPITGQLMYVVKDSLGAFTFEAEYSSGLDRALDLMDFIYEDIKLFQCIYCNDGVSLYVAVKQNGLWGYKKIYFVPEPYLEPKYYSVSSLAQGYALVEYEPGKFGYIDEEGNEYFIR